MPPGELEDAVKGLTGQNSPDVLVGLDDGDDAAAVLVRPDLAVVSTADFFSPVVDDARDWGRIAAAKALSDIYAMGGTP
ncbi:AIR synthase related protein, partial [Pseudomonas syringae group genomosp. 7]|uniref:AIR synthase related protein n=1 Tax=Pseudomonas syringae group genomosp. 7 TaxID=251699 RepID=UPI0037706B58